MDIRTLQLFLSLADTLSFTRTAEQQHMSLSAVSRSLQRMETELGQRLFERDRRSVNLTRAGRRFREYAIRAVEEWQQISADFHQDPDRLSGEVSVYCSVTASYSVLYPILEQFRAAYPGIEINLHTGDQADAVQRIQEGREDIAVAARPDSLSGKIDFLTLLNSPLRFIAPNFPCSFTAGLPVEGRSANWPELPFVMAERGLSRERADSWFRERGKRPRIYAQVAGHEAIAAMVGLGLGVGLVPELVLEASAYRDKLMTLDELEPTGAFPVGLCASRQRLENPLVQAFWQVARASYLPPK